VATCVKEYRLWAIKQDMQLNTHGSMGNWYEKENQGILAVHSKAIGLSRQKNWGQGTKVCIVK
jgi:hypothetical protein